MTVAMITKIDFKNIPRIEKLPYGAKRGFIEKKGFIEKIVKFGKISEIWSKS